MYKILYLFWKPVRELLYSFHKARVRKLIKDKAITIISQNCIGGVIYSIVGEQFLSPTINMFIEDDNFVKLVERLPHYMSIDPIAVDENYIDPINPSIHYPKIGIDDIELCCLHYKTCQEAIDAWNRRRKRINWNKIIVIACSWNMHEQGELVKRICENDQYKTICFTYGQYDVEGCIKLEGKNWHLDDRMIVRPNITDFKPFSYKRFFEDYIFIPDLFS